MVHDAQKVMESTVVGITGSIGAGKSLVGEILADNNVPVIDTDAVVHQLLENNDPIRRAIINRFGPKVLDENQNIDRKKVADIVFHDQVARSQLESILHPAVLAECNRRLSGLTKEPVVAVLVPLLFEAGLEREYDQIWTVTTRDDILRDRLRRKRGMNDGQIEARLKAQLPQEEKARRSHHIIDNSGTVADTSRQIMDILAQLRTS